MDIWKKMKEHIFVDTSALYALLNAKAKEHIKIKSFFNNFKGKAFITNYIFDEIVTLVDAKAGHEKAVLVGNVLLKSPQIEKIWVTPDDEKKHGSFLSQGMINLTALLTARVLL